MHQLDSLKESSQYEHSCAVDMHEDGSTLTIKLQVAGFDPARLSVKIVNNTLVISGTHEEEEVSKDRHYYIRELHTGSFERSIALPRAVDAKQARITYKDGILSVAVPIAHHLEGQS